MAGMKLLALGLLSVWVRVVIDFWGLVCDWAIGRMG